MSSLASLISSVKTNTVNNTLLQKNLSINKKRSLQSIPTKETKKLKTNKTTDISKTNKVLKLTKEDPKVVVFDGSTLNKRPVFESKAAKKAFLSGKANINDTIPNNDNTSVTDKLEDDEEEIQNTKKDKELQDLLATSRLLEEYHVDEMSSKEKRKHFLGKLDGLGLKSNGKVKKSLSMHIGLEAKKKERQLRKLQEAKDTGLYDKSLKHLYVTKPKKNRVRDPGVTNGVGRIKGATLTIGKGELTRLQRQVSKKK
ncbi:unnamed protein product [Cunninghamella blakesleeana]